MSDDPDPSDEDLAKRVRHGSSDAYATLVTRYARRVYSLCLRMTFSRDDADDLAQEIFLRGYRSIGRWDSSRRFAPWLLAIAANACRDHRRCREPQAGDAPRQGAATGPPADAPIIGLEDAAEVRRALAALPPMDRLALLLRYEQELSLDETAAALGIAPSHAAVRIHRAKAKLRVELSKGADRAARPK
ncbi:MAG: sigma-70 family RNA polymerase sigma factor [Planctomycetes bacterium]|nr:sigma-70 family RNA polymerase sigma factor [Planctomycetota bacterium]MBI3848072.1 sigma-70 family RNA polymerase sigma factor [Planctomycetota bacterium]